MEFNYKILKIYRKRNGYTQRQVADTLCIKRVSYQAKEKGRNATSLKQLRCLAFLYELDLSQFLNGSEPIVEKGGKIVNEWEKLYNHQTKLVESLEKRIKELENMYPENPLERMGE